MLKWYVLKHNFNSRQVEPYNALSGWEDDIKLSRKKGKFKTKQEFKDWLLREFRYYYWSKSECEIVVGGLHIKNENELQKIDIFYQLEPNIDIIVDYIIKELNFKFSK